MRILILALATLMTSTAWAGDPCPIQFRLMALGPLGWVKKPVAPEKDAIFKALENHVRAGGCAKVIAMAPKDERIDLGKAKLYPWVLQKLVVDEKRSFRCTDAHKGLAALAAFGEDAVVVYQRGSRRVLLSTAGSQTACIESSKLVGEHAAKGLEALWNGATGKVVKDRHDNP